MAAVHVKVKNNQGHTVTLLLDDEADKERIEYLRTLKKREDIENVTVSKVNARAAKPADEGDE